jgi:hypothetical protein
VEEGLGDFHQAALRGILESMRIKKKHRWAEKMIVVSGWWLTYPSEKYEFVSWEDDIPNWMEK